MHHVFVVVRRESRQAANDLRHREERDSLAVGKTAPLCDGRPERPSRDFLSKSRLADAGGADDGHQPARLFVERRAVRSAQDVALELSADERRVEATKDQVGAGAHLVETPGPHRLALAFEGERFERTGADPVCDEAVGLPPQQDLARLRSLLQARRDVDGVAGRDRLLARRIADDHFAGVDPDPLFKANAVAPLELHVQPRQGAAHLVRRSDGAQSVVLVNDRHAEDRHHGVADELLDRTAVPFQHGSHLLEVVQHHPAHRLRVHALAEAGEARDVAKQHGHRLADERLGPLGHVLRV